MRIGHFEINENGGSLIIAELSANHNQQKDIAMATIRAAKNAGADAIKLQTYTPDTLTIDVHNKHFQINEGTLWDGRTLYDLYREAYTPWDWHRDLFRAAAEEGLICFSSPFDKTAVDFLESLDVPAYKIASFEIQDIPLIEYAAKKGKPMIISTGIADEADVQLAVDTCRDAGNHDIVLLKCTSAYPAPLDLANLRTMVDMKRRFGVEVGLSDHTMGETVPVVAAALGARIIEKHFILDRSLGGPDAEFSLDPNDFSRMVTEVRKAELALGRVTYDVPEKVRANRKFARSLFVVEGVLKGDVISEKNVRSIRPGYGMHPKYFSAIVGKKFLLDVERGTPLSPEMFESE